MSKLEDTLLAVKDENLDKSQLENYHAQLTHFLVDLRKEEARLLKEKALFMVDKDMPDVKAKRMWDASTSGQRLFDIVAYIRSVKPELESLKTRIYSYL